MQAIPLPDDLIVAVSCFLPLASVGALRRVNTSCRGSTTVSTNSSPLWRGLLKHPLPETSRSVADHVLACLVSKLSNSGKLGATIVTAISISFAGLSERELAAFLQFCSIDSTELSSQLAVLTPFLNLNAASGANALFLHSTHNSCCAETLSWCHPALAAAVSRKFYSKSDQKSTRRVSRETKAVGVEHKSADLSPDFRWPCRAHSRPPCARAPHGVLRGSATRCASVGCADSCCWC
jgi:hypothetical protein